MFLSPWDSSSSSQGQTLGSMPRSRDEIFRQLQAYRERAREQAPAQVHRQPPPRIGSIVNTGVMNNVGNRFGDSNFGDEYLIDSEDEGEEEKTEEEEDPMPVQYKQRDTRGRSAQRTTQDSTQDRFHTQARVGTHRTAPSTSRRANAPRINSIRNIGGSMTNVGNNVTMTNFVGGLGSTYHTVNCYGRHALNTSQGQGRGAGRRWY